LLGWLKTNEVSQQELQERHHRENMDAMRSLIDVLKGRNQNRDPE